MNLYGYIHPDSCLDSFISRRVIRIKLGETTGDIYSRNRKDDQTGTPEAPLCVWEKENTSIRDGEFKNRFKDYRLRNRVTKELKEWYEFPTNAPDFDTAMCMVKMKLDAVVGKPPFMRSSLDYQLEVFNEVDQILIEIQVSRSKRESTELFERAIEILEEQSKYSDINVVDQNLKKLYSIMTGKYGNSY